MILLAKDFWEIKKTTNAGRGIFARKTITAGSIIGDYLGRIVHITEVDTKNESENMFLMAFGEESAIVPDLSTSGAHLINHSCGPNASLYPYQDRTLFIALRRIAAGEEITISYNLAPKDSGCDPCTHGCKCTKANCRGTMHLEPEKYRLWRKFWDGETKNTKGMVLESGSVLMPLKSYPSRIDPTKIVSSN